jgi:hypothetical protein
MESSAVTPNFLTPAGSDNRNLYLRLVKAWQSSEGCWEELCPYSVVHVCAVGGWVLGLSVQKALAVQADFWRLWVASWGEGDTVGQFALLSCSALSKNIPDKQLMGILATQL